LIGVRREARGRPRSDAGKMIYTITVTPSTRPGKLTAS
jgi:hypothetical protein